MLKSTDKGIICTGKVWELTEEDRLEIASIFNTSMELVTPEKGHDLRWTERRTSPANNNSYHIFVAGVEK